jgi:hypothetical protein
MAIAAAPTVKLPAPKACRSDVAEEVETLPMVGGPAPPPPPPPPAGPVGPGVGLPSAPSQKLHSEEAVSESQPRLHVPLQFAAQSTLTHVSKMYGSGTPPALELVELVALPVPLSWRTRPRESGGARVVPAVAVAVGRGRMAGDPVIMVGAPAGIPVPPDEAAGAGATVVAGARETEPPAAAGARLGAGEEIPVPPPAGLGLDVDAGTGVSVALLVVLVAFAIR